MEKQNHGTKYLYRKSNCTINTRSKTCSGASQFLTRSGILQMKKKLHKSNYYVVDGKVKRDLSMATDKCILRGIYKRKFGKCKCSSNEPVGTIIEPKRDHNSCGDSITEEHNINTRLNIDVTSLVVENLKDLLSDWIKKYLLKNNETKQKLETVLDSILHNVELQRTASSYTYTLDIKVDEKHHFNSKDKDARQIDTCGKPSCQTEPVAGKHIKLISTLSIPRKIKRHGSTNSKHLKPAPRKIRYKNVFLTISRSSTFLLNSSSCNLLSISTKSFIKRCATYNNDDINSCKKHEDVLLPKSSFSTSTPDTRQNKVDLGLESKVYPKYPNALGMEPFQSLVKSIYADDPANITSTDKNISSCKHDNFTMTDTDCTLKVDTSPVHCNKLKWKKANNTVDSETLNVRKKRKNNTRCKTLSQGSKIRKTKSMKKQMQSSKCVNKKLTDKNNLYKKPIYNQNENNFLKDLQGIFKHFVHYTDSKNIKFDVKINVFPGLGNKVHDESNNDGAKKNTLHNGNLTAAYNVISTQILPEGKTSNSIVENHRVSSNSSQKSQTKLISILDGAISQSKYVISKDGSYESSDKNIIKSHSEKFEPKNTSVGLEIAKDISELRVIIRDLAITTEKFVKEHLKNKPCEIKIKEKSNNVDNNINKDSLKKSTISKAVQHSNNKTLIMSGLKLKKEPKKKDIQEYSTRLGKKSISYNVIESESILKVTDMTSLAADINTDILISETMKCSLPKSKSLFEVAVGQTKRKLLAYYCDELMKSRQFMQNLKCCPPNTYKYTRCPHENNDYSQFINEKTRHEDLLKDEIACEDHQKYTCDEEDCEISGPGYSCSSVYIDVEDRKKIAVRSRGGMGFWEGLFYCILLWIPVVVIFWLIYVYVIRDIIQPVNHSVGRSDLTSKRSSNNSLFHITLTDLGF